MVHRKWFCSP